MVFNATFNNISVILWRPVLLVDETGVTGEITDMSQVTGKLLKDSFETPVGTWALITSLLLTRR